ncbi:MAG: DUF3318 domain-containing protein [Leptolyngbyaceae cyanobacterium bins.349]|nr:DUF3318 domain-containing protein [Leptolyngbyaceae cyanobacterium bins.349]
MYGYDQEIRRLMDVLPASGRMLTKLVSKPDQRVVIDCPFPKPWMTERPIWINFELLDHLALPERDLLVLRTVSWVMGVKWFRPDLYQGVVAVGVLGVVIEAVQADPMGIVAAGTLSAIAGTQIWRNNRSTQRELDADEAAIQVALRRGYSEPEAARHLLSAIAAVADLEKRRGLNFVELLRCQNLKAIAGLSSVTVPETIRQE